MVTMIAMAAKRMSPAFCRILSRPRLPPAQPIQRRLLSQADLANLEAHFRGGAMPRIRVISPIIWACSVSALIYLGCAGFSVYGDVADYKKRHRSTKTPTLAQVDSDAGWSWAPSKRESEMGPIPLWGNLTPIGKDVYSLIAINAGILGAGRIMPLLTMGLAHTPIIPRNSTLFTSTFAHANVLHWAFNAYATVMFGLQVGEGRTFAGSGSHFLSFYLAAGTLSGLGSHLWEALPWRNTFGRAIPSLGASGAVMAIVGSWLMANPTGKIGIMFIPYSWQAQDFLWGLVAFESLGALGALKFLRLSINHASHLSGLGIGAIYTVYDGKKHVWEPARNIAFDILCRTKLV